MWRTSTLHQPLHKLHIAVLSRNLQKEGCYKSTGNIVTHLKDERSQRTVTRPWHCTVSHVFNLNVFQTLFYWIILLRTQVTHWGIQISQIERFANKLYRLLMAWRGNQASCWLGSSNVQRLAEQQCILDRLFFSYFTWCSKLETCVFKFVAWQAWIVA